jgi:hypothetical protein
MGELLVAFDEYGWFPRVLPSEAIGDEAWGSSSSDEEDEDEDE